MHLVKLEDPEKHIKMAEETKKDQAIKGMEEPLFIGKEEMKLKDMVFDKLVKEERPKDDKAGEKKKEEHKAKPEMKPCDNKTQEEMKMVVKKEKEDTKEVKIDVEKIDKKPEVKPEEQKEKVEEKKEEKKEDTKEVKVDKDYEKKDQPKVKKAEIIPNNEDTGVREYYLLFYRIILRNKFFIKSNF